MTFHTLEQFLDYGEQYMLDANRRYITDALADGGDPDDIDCMIHMFADEQAAWRAKTRTALETFLAECRAVPRRTQRGKRTDLQVSSRPA